MGLQILGAKEENFPTYLFDLYFSIELVCWKCYEKSDKSNKSNKNLNRRATGLTPPPQAKMPLVRLLIFEGAWHRTMLAMRACCPRNRHGFW